MRELIDVPVVQTVVRLDDAAAPVAREGLVRDFVLTRQVEKNLRSIAGSIEEAHGTGFFLVGAYGSGKSHFLSYISLVLSGEARPQGAICPLAKSIGKRRLFPVRISLVKIRGGTSLEDAVLDEAEKALAAEGEKVQLSRRSRFLEHVERAIRPIDPAAMDAWLAARRLPPWETLKRDRDRAAVAAWGFAKTLSGCPVEPVSPPDELLVALIEAAKARGFEGVAVVIDELSEFLRSKPTHGALSEDARYLQLMGEISRTEPLWIVASLQEAIEQAGDISRDVIGKIKDRYPIVLNLDEGHVRELIDGRLVRKHDGAREKIRDIWRRFGECLPKFKIDFEDFFRIYPVHPATIGYLDGLKSLLSAHRGVVDFIVAEVRGDPKRGMAGLMGGPADRLLTADLIYTHFRDRVRGDDRFAPYDALVRSDLDRAIAKIFSDESDRELARRASDVLILGEISEIEKPKTVAELAAILLAAVTEVSPEANEQYLAEVILAPLLKECLFVRHEPGSKPGDGVFRVSLTRDSRGLFEKELAQALAGVAPGDSRIARAVFEAAPCQVPLRELIGGAKPSVSISWRGTQRRGVLLWAESTSPAEAAMQLEKEDLDFAVVLAPPGFLPREGESYPDRALLWIPRWEEDEAEEMRMFYGALLLADENRASPSRAVKDEAARAVKEGAAGMGRLVESGFRRGEFSRGTTAAEAGHGVAASGFVERLISPSVIGMLRVVHPKFLEVAPEVEFVSRRALAPLIDAILAPGRISMAQARKNNTRTMIEGVLIPMGLAAAQGPSFVMQLDPARSRLVRDAMDAIGAEGASVSDLIAKFRRGPWGLTAELSILLIVALVRGGLAEIRKGGRRVPSAIVGFSQVEEADDICAGELLAPALRDRLLADQFLSQGIDRAAFSLASQREAWARLINARDRMREHASKTLPRLSALSEYPVFDAFDFDRVRGAIDRGMDALSAVEEAHGSSKGLERWLSSSPPDLASIMREADAASRFASEEAERIVRIADYVRDLPPESVMPAEIAEACSDVRGRLARLTDLVLEGRVGELSDAFDRFFGLYSEWYVEEHRREFSRERFIPFEKIRETPAWRALSAVDAISGIHLVDGAESASRRIDAAIASRCARAPSAELRLKARCGCGFAPGAAAALPDAADILSCVRAGVAEACRALKDGAVVERLVARAAALKDLDPEEAAKLDAFLDRLRGELSVEGFVAAMSPELARILSDALHRRVNVVARDVGSLSGRLSGRRLPPARLREIFEEWLGDLSGEDLLVDLGGNPDEGRSSEALLARWIADHGLDEERARIALLVPPDTKPSPPGLAFDPDAGALGRMAQVAGLAAAPPDECLRFLARERVCRSFAWEAAAALARHVVDGWRQDDGVEIACAFDDVRAWCAALAEAAMPFEPCEVGALIRKEAARDGALSLIVEHRHVRGFPSPQIADRLFKISRDESRRREDIFAKLPVWDIRWDDLAAEFPGAAFLFVDAARWDMIPRIDASIRRAINWKLVREQWSRVPEASTASWQRSFFGADDPDAIASILKKHGARYAGDVERADVAARMREEGGDGPLWMRTGFVDRLIHSSSIPLHRLLDEAVREFDEMITALAGVIKARGALVLLTDHGFSEISSGEKRGSRYAHDASNPQDTVAVMAAYGGGGR